MESVSEELSSVETILHLRGAEAFLEGFRRT